MLRRSLAQTLQQRFPNSTRLYPIHRHQTSTACSKRVAVLIDSENTNPSHVKALFEEVAKLGDANVRRLYGNMATGNNPWIPYLQPLSMVPIQQFNQTTGKNSSDICLVIDAMDLMHTSNIDTFCLVSSDSDFTRLAQRLREHHKMVIGFGERHTPEAFKMSCHRFFYFDNMGIDTTSHRQEMSQAIKLIQKAAKVDEDGWASVSQIGGSIYSIAPDFSPKNYGCKGLVELIRQTKAFEFKARAKEWMIRYNPQEGESRS